MTKYLILHGTDASPDANWFMWLKGKLIGQGSEVWLPQLPNYDKPDPAHYTPFLLANKNFSIDNNTVIIGHSSGSVEALHLVQNLPKDTVIKAALLVSAFKDDLGWDSLTNLFTEPFDFAAIKAHCNKFLFLHSDDDPYCPIEHADYLAEQTGGDVIEFQGQGHFNTDLSPEYKQFPELLEIINDL